MAKVPMVRPGEPYERPATWFEVVVFFSFVLGTLVATGVLVLCLYHRS